MQFIKRKGFSLLEVLLTLFIISSLSVIVCTKINEPHFDYLYFLNDYLNCQSKAICNKEEISMSNSYGYPIMFNKDGKVNMAQSIDIDSKKIIIHLGTGYPTYE